MHKMRCGRQRGLRPTTGRVREALFDILRGKTDNARFLDLYAGSGTVGVEALRQGALKVVFVDVSRSNIKSLQKTVDRYHYAERVELVAGNVISYIEQASRRETSFDLIFLDPPYHTEDILHALSALGSSDILAPEGLVIAEHFTKRQLPDKFDKLQKLKEYQYGDTVLSFYGQT